MDYKNELAKVENNGFFVNELITKDAQAFITEITQMKKIVDEAEKKMRELLLSEMQDKGIIKVDAGSLQIIRKDAYTREGIDTKRLKAERPEIYDEFCKLTEVKESVVVKCS